MTKKPEDQRIHEPLLKTPGWWAAETIWIQASLNVETMPLCYMGLRLGTDTSGNHFKVDLTLCYLISPSSVGSRHPPPESGSPSKLTTEWHNRWFSFFLFCLLFFFWHIKDQTFLRGVIEKICRRLNKLLQKQSSCPQRQDWSLASKTYNGIIFLLAISLK